MNVTDENLMKSIKENLVRHGTLSVLIYKMSGEWIISRWGDYEKLGSAHEELFRKYRKAGFTEEADSILLLDLPKDPNSIYRILSGPPVENEFAKLGVILP